MRNDYCKLQAESYELRAGLYLDAGLIDEAHGMALMADFYRGLVS